jgi:hypothetical protein
MYIEKKLPKVAPRALTANGTADGLVQVADSRGFYVKQQVYLVSSTQLAFNVEIKRFISPTAFYVGLKGDIGDRSDITAFLTADTATIQANEQGRSGITLDERKRAVYMEEPIAAERVISVDERGQPYNTQNPVPVQLSDGSINIGTVNAELEVQLSHMDNVPDIGDVADSVRIGDGVDELGIEPDGSINVNVQDTPAANSGLSHTYVEVLGVAASLETTLVTVLGGLTQKRIQKIEVSGTNVAEFRVKLNGSVVTKKRTWWTRFNETFDFEQFSNGFKILSVDTLTVTVIHVRPYVGDFNVTVWYL